LSSPLTSPCATLCPSFTNTAYKNYVQHLSVYGHEDGLLVVRIGCYIDPRPHSELIVVLPALDGDVVHTISDSPHLA
jgi:hypothetical protein